MRLSIDWLRRYCDGLPEDRVDLRHLLDDLGLEVKRLEEDEDGPAVVLELLANRGDHHCYAGVARELTGRLGGGLRLPEVAVLEAGEPPVPLRVETDLCLVYALTALDLGPGDARLPEEVLRPLRAAGLHSVSPAVDATNLSNLELGQPTHCFDADAVRGGITIRLSRRGERAWPLFQANMVDLPEGTLVIADDEKILAVAGVIGCEESKVHAGTRRVLLESAAFDPVSVRKASRALGIQTDSSARFERGSDPSLPLPGAGRVVHLLEAFAGAHRRGTTGVAGSWTDPRRILILPLTAATTFLEREVSAAEAQDRLQRYGFAVTGRPGESDLLDVRVPPHRLWDVHSREDLYEELARSIGYGALPTTLPQVSMGVQPSPREQVKARVEEVLLGTGFYEVFTDGFYGRPVREALGLGEEHPLWAHVETLNAQDRAFSLLKNNCLAQALEAVSANLRFQNEQVKAYEWTRTFHPDPTAANGVCTERRLLWLVVNGRDREPSWGEKPREADVWFLKGLVEELATELGIPLSVGPVDPAVPLSSCLHPHRQGTVRLGARTVGILGEAHPQVARALGIKRGRPCYLEIEADALFLDEDRSGYALPPVRPPSVRMLAFTLPAGVEAEEVGACLRASAPEGLEQVAVVDLFAHEEEDRPVRTLTFALQYRNDDARRSVEELNAATEGLVQAVEAALGGRGVKLRA